MTTTTTTIARTSTTIPRLIPGTEAHRTQPYVSASVAAELFGIGWHGADGPATLAAIRRGDLIDEAGEAAAMGNDLEPFILDHFEREHGLALWRPTETYVCGRLSANPDAYVPDEPVRILVQAKFSTKVEGHLSPGYWWQGQCEMACTGAEVIYFHVLWGGSGCWRTYIVQRDEQAIEHLHEVAETFFATIDLGMDPEMAGTLDRGSEEVVQLGEAEAELVRQQRLAQEAKRDAEKEAKRLSAEIGALTGAISRRPGTRLVLLDADGVRLGSLRVANGKAKQIADPSGERGAPYLVMED